MFNYSDDAMQVLSIFSFLLIVNPGRKRFITCLEKKKRGMDLDLITWRGPETVHGGELSAGGGIYNRKENTRGTANSLLKHT